MVCIKSIPYNFYEDVTMNNFKKCDKLNNDDNHKNSMDEQNIEVVSSDAFDREYAYESHFTPYEDLYSDSNYDF